MLDDLTTWFFGLGEAYGVDPLIFGAIYVGAIPLFALSVAWLVRNVRQKKSPVVPALAAGVCFVSAYVYLLVAGENVPLWVYGAVVILVVGGAWSAVRSVRGKIAAAKTEDAGDATPGVDASGVV